jgi:hypothetical protein
MNEKQTCLLRVSYLVEIEKSKSEEELLDNISFELSQDRYLSNEKLPVTKLGWEMTLMQVLDPQKNNCGRCAICNSWVTDIEKPDPINGINIGATVAGQLLCDEHLPKNHPLAF